MDKVGGIIVPSAEINAEKDLIRTFFLVVDRRPVS